MSTVLNTIYNNYLTAYTPRSLTRYDTHKKSELRTICNSIAKLNKEAPWYLPTTSRETQNYAVDLKENARRLHNTIAQLGGLEENGIFSKKNAYSSDEELVSVSYLDNEAPKEGVEELSLDIRQLASPQENLGLFLTEDTVDLPPDDYSFDVHINDVNYEFQFSISGSESNLDIQNRLVRLINNADIGLKASLAESDSRHAIRLLSKATGASSEKPLLFTVSDDNTSKSSGIVDYFGMDYVNRNACNAEFSINGEPAAAPSNHFLIGKSFEVELHGTTVEDSPVKIGLKTDTEALTDNVLHLVGGYNDFLKAAASYLTTQSRSQKLVREFSTIASHYGNSFASMGVNFNSDGSLAVDSDLLHQAASESEDIVNTFGYLKDFSASLLHKSDQVSLNPMDYVEKKIVAYKNPGHNFPNPYATSAYSGMMFDGYC